MHRILPMLKRLLVSEEILLRTSNYSAFFAHPARLLPQARWRGICTPACRFGFSEAGRNLHEDNRTHKGLAEIRTYLKNELPQKITKSTKKNFKEFCDLCVPCGSQQQE